MSAFRYPGAKPFQSSQQDIFFGREKDIEEFYELLSLEQHIVLYSKSGLGKSSLLNAGIIPKIQAKNTHFPIPIRFGAFSSDKKETPLEITAQALASFASGKSILDKIIKKESSLWYHTKRLQQEAQYDGFILIFDQFEELFTYPEEAIVEFKKQLAELIHTEIPNRFREVVGKQFQAGEPTILTEEELEFFHHPVEVKIVMSIRSDRMSLLNNLSNYLPNILRTWYKLDALTTEQAEEAILNPAYKKDERFLTPPFDYSDDAIEEILNYLSKNRKQRIESFQLQILCQAFERKVINEKLKKIKLSHLDNLQGVYENYYENQVSLLETQQERQAARELIEEGLIFDEEQRRLSLYEGQIYKQFGFTPELLNKLVNVHLLRAEPSLKGGYTYELSHDTMVDPILKAKKKRKAAEEKQAEENARQKQNEEMKALREEAKLERRKRIRARTYAVLGVGLAIIAISSSIYAGKMAQKANHQVFDLIKADYERLLAEGRQLQQEEAYEEALEHFEDAQSRIEQYGTRIDNGGSQARELMANTRLLEGKSIQYDSLFSIGRALFEKGATDLISAKKNFQAAKALNINLDRNRKAQLEIEETNRTIQRAYKRYKEIGDRFKDVGELKLACSNYKIAATLNPEDLSLQRMINEICPLFD